MNRWVRGAIAGTILATAAPGVAHADPAGCGGAAYIGISSTGVMTATGEASCNGLATRTYRIEIKQNKNLAPDPLVAANSQTGQGRGYYVRVSSCDGGKTADYYGRGFFTTNTTYHDTASHRWQVC